MEKPVERQYVTVNKISKIPITRQVASDVLFVRCVICQGPDVKIIGKFFLSLGKMIKNLADRLEK